QTDYLTDISQSGEHLLALINDILDLAKVEAGKVEVQAESFSLLGSLTKLLSMLRPLADSRGVGLYLQSLQADGPVHTDPARFRQILYNLLSSAIKFTPAGGRATVTCSWLNRPERGANGVAEEEAEAVQVSVRDTGIGIAPEDQTAVWDEFRQVNNHANQD